MDLQGFFISLMNVVCEMAPYLLLGFFIAGVLHVFVPQKFYANYLSRKNKLSVLWAALLGIPLPLCSCGVIPTAIGLRNEKASKGAIASFLIATPQTGIDSILATFSLMGLGFAIVRPVAALITGVCGGLLVNRLVREDDLTEESNISCQVERGNRLWRVLKYAYYDMIRDIGLRLLIGLIVAALIQVMVPDEFFLSFGSQPLLQMLVILVIAVPMYICSTGSIPVAAALMMKGLSPGAALVMLMAGPAVNLASILVVHKSMGRRFTLIYLMTIVGFAVLFGLILNATGFDFSATVHDACCINASALPSPFKLICATILTLLILFALMMKLFSKLRANRVPSSLLGMAEVQPKVFKFTTKKPLDSDVVVYRVEDMHCSHCEAAVVRAVEVVPGVEKAKASASANTLTIKGPATEEAIRSAVEGVGYTFKGRSSDSKAKQA
ncbi:MAG: permease [Prevotella sp.]|nr:permease [Prevotella sp.]